MRSGYQLLPTSLWSAERASDTPPAPRQLSWAPTLSISKRRMLVAAAVAGVCLVTVGWALYPGPPPPPPEVVPEPYELPIVPVFTPLTTELPGNFTIASVPVEGEVDGTGRIQMDLGEEAMARYDVDAHEGGDKIFFNRLIHFVEEYMPPTLKDTMLDSIALRLPPSLHTLLERKGSSDPALLKPAVEFRNIFQTDKNPPGPWSFDWVLMNSLDRWALDFYDDARAEQWVDTTFPSTEPRGIKWSYHSMRRGVLKADFLRYLLPLVEGGVYIDTDTRPLQPINAWGTHEPEFWDIGGTDGADWKDTLQPLPAMIVGIEIDIHERLDWANPDFQWAHPLGICQWAFASAPYHPILQEITRRVVNSSHVVADTGKQMNVLHWTGPGAFTNAVMSYLSARYNVTWKHLRGRRRPLRIGEVMVLPVTGFSPLPGGRADFGAEKSDSPQCALVHMFNGSWKSVEDGYGEEELNRTGSVHTQGLARRLTKRIWG